MNQTVQIDDPLHSHNNVGKSSFKFFEIKVPIPFLLMINFRNLLNSQARSVSLDASVTATTTASTWRKPGRIGPKGSQTPRSLPWIMAS
jgi:hypothetical protein